MLMCLKRQYDLGLRLRIKGEVREQVVSKGAAAKPSTGFREALLRWKSERNL